MVKSCYFCSGSISDEPYVDIGGLVLCVSCYELRSTRRTHLPCHICREPVAITPNPLTMQTICGTCEAKVDLCRAYEAARRVDPCARCGKVTEHHHPSVYGQNLCHACYEAADRPCTQLYAGDRGYPAFEGKPSVPALVLPLGSGGPPCVVCNKGLDNPRSLAQLHLAAALCPDCPGPKWWALMDSFRGEPADDPLIVER